MRLTLWLLAASAFYAVDLTSHADDFPTPYNTEPEDATPMSAEEAAATAILPAGFRCEVFAAEPDVQQPIAMCFDDRGRLWVAECYTYAERPQRWDPNLRDRIIILEDTNGDGRADERQVFWDRGDKLTSIAHSPGGVWALCAPHLLFIPDANGDDIPDGEPQVILDGFDADNSGHNVVNGLKFGPDGWLYGRHGITATSLVGKPGTPTDQRTPLNCSIWRYHPQRKTFEVFCHGGTNPWGLDWNADGQLFYTNTVIGHLWHAIPGAYYERMFGAHLNPYVYDVITHTADHYHWDTGEEKWNDIRAGVSSRTSQLGGGHAHMGCLIYQGGVWPAEYQGNLFTCNLHGRRVNREVLHREGCGYVARHAEDFLMMQDPFFRGLDLLTGPDGQMWISDWSDTGECHDNTGVYRTSGRIYRVVYEGSDQGRPTPERPKWLRRRGQQQLSEADLQKLFDSPEEGQRAMAVRWLSEDTPQLPSTWSRLQQLAQQDKSGLVRLEVAAALQRLPLASRWPIAASLSEHEQDRTDRQQSLLIWYGISDAVIADPTQATQLAMTTRLPQVRQLISRRLVEQLDESPEVVDQLLRQTLQQQSAGVRADVISGMEQALRGRLRAQAPSCWNEVCSSANHDGTDEERDHLRELSLLFGDGRARDELLAIVRNMGAEPSARRFALESLLKQPTEDLLPHLKDWVNDKVVSREAVRGLAYFDGPGISLRLINHWQRFTLHRSTVIDSLVARPTHAADLLDAIAEGTLPRDAISPYQARQIDNLGDAKLSSRLRDVWGEIRETPAEKQREMERWKSILTPEAIAAASPAQGKLVYQQQCGTCHQLYGDGKNVGPNLTGSDRHNLDYLLGNMIDPNAIVPADYRMSIFLLDDGRVVSGVISERGQRSVTVQTPEGAVSIDQEQIVESKPTTVSLMPEGQLNALSEEAVRNLVAYLMTSDPREAH